MPFDPDAYLKKKAAPAGGGGFDPDAYLAKKSVPSPKENSTVEALAGHAVDGLKAAGKGIAQGATMVADVADELTGAKALRAGISSLQNDTKYVDEYKRNPSLKDIYGQAGMSTDETISTPIVQNPFDPKDRYVKMSPAGIAGGITGAAIDPTTYMGMGVAKTGAKLGFEVAEGLAKPAMKAVTDPVAGYLKKVAAERAVKAATGQNVGALRNIAKITAKNPGDLARAEANIGRAGRDMLDEGVLGYFDTPETLAPKLSAKRKEYGQKIGEIGAEIDQAVPGAVDFQKVAQRWTAYADSLPDTPKGKALKERIYERAAEMELAGKQSFAHAQFEKGQYKFNPTEADTLVSNQDISNKLRSGISDEMTDTASALAKDAPDPRVKELLESYGAIKGKYGSFKSTSDAATARAVSNLSNRFVSPSDHGMGMATGVASAVTTGGLDVPSLVKGAVAAGANKQARTRGSAFAARSLDKVAKTLEQAPEALGKFRRALEVAAQSGAGSLSVTHHLLLENDPEYRTLMGAD